MRNFEKSFFRVREIKMAASNEERLTLATDDTMKELRNGAKNVNTSRRNNFNPQLTVSRKFPGSQQQPLSSSA